MSESSNQRYEKGRNNLYYSNDHQFSCDDPEGLGECNDGNYPTSSASVGLCIDNGLASIIPEPKTPAEFQQVWDLARKGFYWDIKPSNQ